MTALGMIAINFGKKADEEFYKVFMSNLSDIEADWMFVAKKVCDTYTFMPGAKGIRDVALSRPTGPSKIQAAGMLADLSRHVSKYGYNNQKEALTKAPPELYALIQKLGGWQSICRSNLTDGPEFFKNQAIAQNVVDAIAVDDSVLLNAAEEQKYLMKPQQALTATKNETEGVSSFDPKKLIKEAFSKFKSTSVVDSDLTLQQKKEEALRKLKNET